jgi:omega-hydroxy-beta-dihydromenaquinone-9 sulfotransferase
MNTTKAIFVLGYMRSGTTLLFRILGNHPSVFTLKGEPKIIEYRSIARQYYPDLTDDKILQSFICFLSNVVRFGHPLKYFGQPLIESPGFNSWDVQRIFATLLNRDYFSIFYAVYDYFARAAGKSIWCIKAQVLEAEAIMANFPGAQFVEIVRDPRDVLASKKNDRDAVWHSGRYKPEQRPIKELYNTYDPLWDSLSWKAEIQAGMNLYKKDPSRFYSVRYEDLVTKPDQCIRKMSDFLGIAYDNGMVEVNERNSSVWDRQYKGIGAESVRKWQKKLTPEEIALCQWVTQSEMQSLEYDIAQISLFHRVKVIGLLELSIKEFLQRLIKRYRLGGWAYLRNVLSLYWKKWLTLR